MRRSKRSKSVNRHQLIQLQNHEGNTIIDAINNTHAFQYILLGEREIDIQVGEEFSATAGGIFEPDTNIIHLVKDYTQFVLIDIIAIRPTGTLVVFDCIYRPTAEACQYCTGIAVEEQDKFVSHINAALAQGAISGMFNPADNTLRLGPYNLQITRIMGTPPPLSPITG